jgi:hypothetical protein
LQEAEAVTEHQANTGTDTSEAVAFLECLRPGGPWVLSAIVPDGAIETITVYTAAAAEEFIRRHNGRSNLYYSVNPTRTDRDKKAAKTDIAQIEYALADLDPEKGETADQAKARYLAQLNGTFEPKPTATVDSGNGIQGLWKLKKPIVLGAPILDANTGKLKFAKEDQDKIDDVEARIKAVMLNLHSKAGTQNIDRILRVPSTVNLPTKVKREAGRVPCQTKLLWFNGSTYELDEFPSPAPGEPTGGDGAPGSSELPKYLLDLLGIPNAGASKQHYKYKSRHALLLAFLILALKANIDREVIISSCLDDARRGYAIREHIREKSQQNGERAYVERQIERALKKIIDKVEIKEGLDEAKELPEGVTLDDFLAYMPDHDYIYKPTGDSWPGASVNAKIAPVPLLDANGNPKLKRDGSERRMQASAWLDRHRSVEQMTWAPGLPVQIADRLIADGGWIERKGVSCFNLYKPPTIVLGDPKKARRWLVHVRTIYPHDMKYIVRWLAHRVQRPCEKPNHALALIGAPGIGKDTILEPIKHAVGPWNFREIPPTDILGNFNPFAKSIILRISEARDLGDISRYAFYEAMKSYCASPPDVLRVNEKNKHEHYVPNLTGVIITTNYKDSLYLPPNDRRHYVAFSEKTEADFDREYFNDLWKWYFAEGFAHVAAYLAILDIRKFNPKAPPPKTAAFWEVVNINRSSEDAELSDQIDALGNPDAVTVKGIIGRCTNPDLTNSLTDRRTRRAIPHWLERCGYVSVRNPDAQDRVWKVENVRQPIYAKKTLTPSERIAAARNYTHPM